MFKGLLRSAPVSTHRGLGQQPMNVSEQVGVAADESTKYGRDPGRAAPVN
jgi:hypothetical protein